MTRSLLVVSLAVLAVGPSCNCDPDDPALIVAVDVAPGVRVNVAPFRIDVGDAGSPRDDAACPPLFVDVRPIGAGTGFVKPEAPPAGLLRYASTTARVIAAASDGAAQLDVTLTNGDDEKHATVTLRADGEDFAHVDVAFDIEDYDVAFVGACFALGATGHLVGGGEVFNGPDLRGKITPLYFAAPRPTSSSTNEAHAPVPFIAITNGVGVLVETERVGAVDALTHATGANDDAVELRFHGTSLPLRVRAGSIVDNAAAHARVMGLPPPPPRWALAPMQWRNDLEVAVDDVTGDITSTGADMLLNDLSEMRARGFPVSTVWIDAPWETGYNTFVVNETQLPNFADMMQTLEARGVHAIVWATEHVNSSDDSGQMIGMPENATREQRNTFRDNGWLVTTDGGDPFEFPWGRGNGTFVDFTNADACAGYRALMRPLLESGIRGFKLDYGETMRADILGIDNDIPVFSDGSTTRVQHTRYARLYHECYLAELRDTHADDWFVITRTGGIGDQHNGTTIWPGDLDASFLAFGDDDDGEFAVGGLPSAVAGYLSLAMSGYPLYGSDVGGYRGSAPTPELFARWAQFGALSTIMQVGGGENFAPWDAGYEDVVDEIVRAARVHMQLWPMWEEWLARATSDGTPVAVPVGVLAGEDADAWADVATFVVGDVLLVAPVIEEGAVTRTLFVPDGAWVPFDDAGPYEPVTGPALVTVDAPLTGGVPLWVRAGTTLTLADPQLMSLLDTALAEDGGFNHFAQTSTRTFE